MTSTEPLDPEVPTEYKGNACCGSTVPLDIELVKSRYNHYKLDVEKYEK
jgi:hypothetical protein